MRRSTLAHPQLRIIIRLRIRPAPIPMRQRFMRVVVAVRTAVEVRIAVAAVEDIRAAAIADDKSFSLSRSGSTYWAGAAFFHL